ncbi:MAG: hypothetical protein E4H09_04090 [Spirochaetales bacterium]|nr:MAG: hypothetical protein E4H09_04090 [Spirochaetales bacterium]
MVRPRSIWSAVLTVAVVAVTVLMASCNSELEPRADQLVVQMVRSELQDESISVGTEDTELIQVQADPRNLALPADLAIELSIEPGSVLVCGPSESHPLGLLRKVVTMTTASGTTTLVTELATLEDAYAQLDVTVSGTRFDDADVEANMSVPGMSVLPAQTKRDVELTGGSNSMTLNLVNVVVYDVDEDPETTDDQISFDGSITISADYEIDWSLGDLSFSYKFQPRVVSSLMTTATFDSSIPVGAGGPVEIANFKKRVLLGSPPVLLTPTLSLKLGLDGEVSVGLEAGFVNTTTLTLAAEFSSGSWTDNSDIDVA